MPSAISSNKNFRIKNTIGIAIAATIINKKIWNILFIEIDLPYTLKLINILQFRHACLRIFYVLMSLWW